MTGVEALDSIEVTLSAGSRIGLTLGLAIMIFSVALTLKPDDFVFLAKRPKMFFGGLATQILGLPLMTLGLAHLISPPASVAFGMIVVACCPGGNVSNLMVLMSRGNAAYSVSLTAASNALAFIITPFAILGWAALYPPTADLIRAIEIETLPFILQTAMALGVPLAIGMLLSTFQPGIAKRIQPIFYVLAIAILVGLVTIGLISNWELIMNSGDVIAPVAILHNALAFALGAVAGLALRLESKSRRALTFEIGIQNAGLGLVILLTQFPTLGGAAAVTGFWSIWHLFAGIGLALAFRFYDHLRKTDGVKT
ncbi:bile acid:sodium symporter family protein [Hyphobacterium sp.]|uniref:bile acid:sodium symporter family protein n=1 Tax=Hyphobacterium sp. TaxID=2004662 RepID=UPI003BABA591